MVTCRSTATVLQASISLLGSAHSLPGLNYARLLKLLVPLHHR